MPGKYTNRQVYSQSNIHIFGTGEFKSKKWTTNGWLAEAWEMPEAQKETILKWGKKVLLPVLEDGKLGELLTHLTTAYRSPHAITQHSDHLEVTPNVRIMSYDGWYQWMFNLHAYQYLVDKYKPGTIRLTGVTREQAYLYFYKDDKAVELVAVMSNINNNQLKDTA